MDEMTAKIAADYRRTFSTPCGKRVLDHLMICNFIFHPARDGIDEGKRRLVLDIMKLTMEYPTAQALAEMKEKGLKMIQHDPTENI